jgi:hypothetical protein
MERRPAPKGGPAGVGPAAAEAVAEEADAQDPCHQGAARLDLACRPMGRHRGDRRDRTIAFYTISTT